MLQCCYQCMRVCLSCAEQAEFVADTRASHTTCQVQTCRVGTDSWFALSHAVLETFSSDCLAVAFFTTKALTCNSI